MCCVGRLLIRLVGQRDTLRLAIGPCWRVQRRQTSAQHAHRFAAGAAPGGSQRRCWGGCCGGCRSRRRPQVQHLNQPDGAGAVGVQGAEVAQAPQAFGQDALERLGSSLALCHQIGALSRTAAFQMKLAGELRVLIAAAGLAARLQAHSPLSACSARHSRPDNSPQRARRWPCLRPTPKPARTPRPSSSAWLGSKPAALPEPARTAEKGAG